VYLYSALEPILAKIADARAAGRNGWFRSGISDKMSSSRIVKTHQIFFEFRKDIFCKAPARSASGYMIELSVVMFEEKYTNVL
jgi:hypothetical protein